MEEKNKTTAARLQQAREQKGWTQGQAAKYCGISKALISAIENGTRSLTRDKAHTLAQKLGVYEEWLLGNTDAKSRDAELDLIDQCAYDSLVMEEIAYTYILNHLGYDVQILQSDPLIDFSDNESAQAIDQPRYAIKPQEDIGHFLPAVDSRLVDGVFYLTEKEMTAMMQQGFKYMAMIMNDHIEYTK